MFITLKYLTCFLQLEYEINILQLSVGIDQGCNSLIPVVGYAFDALLSYCEEVCSVNDSFVWLQLAVAVHAPEPMGSLALLMRAPQKPGWSVLHNFRVIWLDKTMEKNRFRITRYSRTYCILHYKIVLHAGITNNIVHLPISSYQFLHVLFHKSFHRKHVVKCWRSTNANLITNLLMPTLLIKKKYIYLQNFLFFNISFIHEILSFFHEFSKLEMETKKKSPSCNIHLHVALIFYRWVVNPI